MFWKDKQVLVTGGTGFIGSHLVDRLLANGARVTILDHEHKIVKNSFTLSTHAVRMVYGDCGNLGDCERACEGQEIVMNLAAHVGGIEYNRTHQATMLSDNLVIANTVMVGAQRQHVQRFLVVSSACVYPHDALIPTPESEGFRNSPEPTNGGYGWAKRMAECIGSYYAEQFGMQVGIVRPYNAYGPRDNFDKEKAHVIPALIRRVVMGENPLIVWGSGDQTRAFMYVEDLAEGMMKAIEKYPVPDPLNLGSDEEISIRDLVQMIVQLADQKNTIQFDNSKPDGSPRRNSDNAKAKKILGFTAKTSLRKGLEETISWYRSQK